MRSTAALLVVCLALVRAAAAAQDLSPAERQGIVARAWSGASYVFAYWDRVRADWDSALTATLAAAARPQTDVDFLRRMRRFVALLEHGQTELLPAGNARDRTARPPLQIVSVERRPFILDYAENDEMRVARPERNAEIVGVQGMPVERWIGDSVLPLVSGTGVEDRWRRAVAMMLEGPRGTAVHLLLRLPDGATRGASVTRSVPLGARWPLEPRSLEVDTLPDRSVLVRLNNFDDPDLVRDFDRAFPDFRGVRGLVLDLRSNGSAASATGYAVLARLVSRPFVTVRWRTPQFRASDLGDETSPVGGAWHVSRPDTVRPRADRPAYAGPVAALAGGATADAGEDFLVALRNAGRGPIIGDPTAGHSGRAVTLSLARGWRLRLCAARHAFPDGSEFVGTGIEPEQRAPLTVADLLNGRDAALERAREYLSGRAVSGP